MKRTAQLLSVMAAMKAVSATGGTYGGTYDWLNNGGNGYNPVAYSSDSCTSKQATGYDFSDAPQGNMPVYDDFNFSGYKCSKSKLQRRSGGGQGSNCASAKVEPQNYGNEITCGKTFSVNEIHVSVEIPSTIEFTYGMPDGTSCKQVTSCGSGITAVKNTQCGGAKSVKCRLHSSSPNQKTCGFNIHHIQFHCNDNSRTSTTAPAASSTSKLCNGYDCQNGAGSSSTTTTRSLCNGYDCNNGAGSSTTTARTTTTTSSVCNGNGCGSGSSTTSSSAAAATTTTVCNGAGCDNGSSSTTACYGAGCGGGSSSSTTACYGAGCGGGSSSSTTACYGAGCGGGSSSTTACYGAGCENGSGSTTSSVCNGYGCNNNGNGATSTTRASTTVCNGYQCGNGATSSTPGAQTTATSSASACYGYGCGGGAVGTTATTSSPGANAECTGYTCNGGSVPTTTPGAGYVCTGYNCNAGPATTPSSRAPGYVCTDYSCTAKPTPTYSQPGGVPDYGNPSSSKPAGVPDYSAPSDSPYKPPVNGNNTVPTTTKYGPVPVVTNCPSVLPKCMGTWTKITQCINSGDVKCLCPNADYINNVAQCVEAWSEDDTEVINALQYMRGLCAQYIPSNPAIVTAVPSYVTVPPASTGATTIVVSTTVTVPCTNGPASATYAPGYTSYTTQVIATTVTVCPVKLVATEPSKPVLVPETVTVPAYVPAPTQPANVPAPYPTASAPAYVPTTMATSYPTAPAPPAYNGTTPNPPVATGAASSVKTFSSLALAGVIGITALIMA
ncbi:hypothetical protein Dda_5207 [Drechslerella dactyloides]|uniref:CFEM domain-containing protein n=1 Tax=Drechslerella dactyloides TaxID=74499 RepID=A0AAD6NIL2_DREDA|nr:hypothetical protein Dda_5207 [Drechslerella dactyloides]